MGLYATWFLGLDYVAKYLGWQLLLKQIAAEKWKFAIWKMKWPFNFLTFHILQGTMQKTRNQPAFKLSSIPRIRKHRVQTVLCITIHKAVLYLDYFFALTHQYKYSFSYFFSFLLEYGQRAHVKILTKQEPSMKNLIQKIKW